MGDVLTFRPPPERFVNAEELARILGVGRRTIAKLVNEGLPSETWGLRSRRFLPSECISWLRERAA